jgi:hypothetical protein
LIDSLKIGILNEHTKKYLAVKSKTLFQILLLLRAFASLRLCVKNGQKVAPQAPANDLDLRLPNTSPSNNIQLFPPHQYPIPKKRE